MRWRVSLAGAAILVLAHPAVVAAQQLGRASDDDLPLWRVALALLICLALAVGAAFALRYKMKGGTALPLLGEKRVILIERTRLSHQVDVCLVRCDGKEFLITTSPRDTRIGPQIGSADGTLTDAA